MRLQIRNHSTGILKNWWTTANTMARERLGFEENWLKPRIKALGYSHVRFFGGTTFEYDGSFRERVCELAMPGSASAEFFIYG